MNDTKDLSNVPEVPVSLPPPRFANPFQGLKGDPTAATVNCLMPKDAFVRVKQCRLEGGTIQTTMNLLWIKLINLLDQKGINSYADVREFEDAVQRAVLVLPEDLIASGSGSELPGSTPPHINPATHVGDVAGAVESIRSSSAGEPQQSDVPSNVEQGSPKRSKGGTKRSKSK